MASFLWVVAVLLVLLWALGFAASWGPWIWFLPVLALVLTLITLVARGQRL